MYNDDPEFGFGSGIFCGIILGIFLYYIFSDFPTTDKGKYNLAIAECEKSLPRDKHCKVIGVAE